MLKITYKKRYFLDRFTCVDDTQIILVKNKAFERGELVYFNKDPFNYFVIEKENIIKIENV